MTHVWLASLLWAFAAASSPATQPLMVYYSSTYTDNAVVTSNASLDATYTLVGTDLDVFTSQAAGAPHLSPLNLYANQATRHTITTSSDEGIAWALANGYTLVGIQGYVIPSDSPGISTAHFLPLEMWRGAARGDYFLVGSAADRANAVLAGYVKLYRDAFAPPRWVPWINTSVPASMPFPKSKSVLGVEIAQGGQAVIPGIGADTWYPSWGRDGNLYSSWTDGTVDGVSSGSGGSGATTGFATVLGNDPFELTLANVSVFAEPADPYQGRYPSLCFHHDGVWYYGTYSLENFDPKINPGPDCGNWCVQGPFTEVRYDNVDGTGRNWTAPRRDMRNATDNLFHENAMNNGRVKYGAPHAVDFGQNNAHSPDGKMYMVGHGGESPFTHQSWMQGDSVYLARTMPDPTTINTASSWEFWSGEGDAWSTAFADAKPILIWMNHTGVVTMSYHPALSKYILCVSTPTVSPFTVYHFDTYFLESDTMYGPWSYVTYMASFGPQAYFVHIPSKFMGQQTYVQNNHTYYNVYLSYSANFASGYQPDPSGSGYHWSLQMMRFRLK